MLKKHGHCKLIVNYYRAEAMAYDLKTNKFQENAYVLNMSGPKARNLLT